MIALAGSKEHGGERDQGMASHPASLASICAGGKMRAFTCM